jgi:hypothetical protein
MSAQNIVKGRGTATITAITYDALLARKSITQL